MTASKPSTPSTGPLQGLRVIELAAIGPVPLCGMLLADLGADVVRIDRLEPSGLGVPMPTRFDVNARGRRSVALDLKAAAGRAAVQRLVDGADVLLEGFRPGVLEKLGLAPSDCQARNPALVVGRMTGFGQTGPLAPTAGHDLNYLALSGALHAMGPAGGAPLPPLNLVADYGGGALYLAFGVMAALFERQRSGCGQVVDAAMVDGAASLASIFYGLQAAGQWDGARGRNLLDGGAPFYTCYETADGLWLSVAPLEPKFFATFAERLGLEPRFVQRQYDRKLWPELRVAIATVLGTKTRAEWARVFDGSDACVAPVLSFEEAPAHAHARAREAFVKVAGVTQPGPAPRFSRSTVPPPREAPVVGEHTCSVLAEAGWQTDEIAALLQTGAARQASLDAAKCSP